MQRLDGEALVQAGVEAARARTIARGVETAQSRGDALAAWREVTKAVLSPDDPFAAHQIAHRAVFADWDVERRGPAPIWVPSAEEIAASNLGRESGGDFRALHRASVEEPEGFWRAMIARLRVTFEVAPPRVVEGEGESARWLPGARLNVAASALAGDPDRLAVVHRVEGRPLERRSRGELRADVHRVMGALGAAGFAPGDAIAIDMPMGYEAVVVYLAIVAFGGAVVSIADSFAAGEIAARLRIAGAKGIFTQDVIRRADKALPLYRRVVEAQAPRAVVLPAGNAIVEPLRAGDLSWRAFLEGAPAGDPSPHVADADDTTNVLFSSGTTGDPKAIVWTHITPIKAATDGWGHHDIRPGDVVAWPTNLGWMMGPWLIYASLLNRAAIALYEGAPQGRDFGVFVEEAGVTMLGVVPSLVKAWKSSGCMEGLDWSGLRCFSSTGEASNADEMHWLAARAGYKPVIEYCGGTEIGGGYITGTVVEPQVAAAFSTPALGSDFVILDEAGHEADLGELALVAPMLGSSSRLLNRDHHEVYFAGMPRDARGRQLRRHGDQMRRLPGGYYRALGRVDDTMNLGGIKTSSAEIERVLARVVGVRETAAIAVSPPEGGPSLLVIYAVLEVSREGDELKVAFSQAIREHLNPLFKVHDVVVVPALPRTASNKVMRRVLRDGYA
jgi:acetyl-CoA synthetase